MKPVPLSLLAVVFSLALGACSSMDALNPFASSGPKVKPADLAAIQPTSELVVLWKESVGSAGKYTLSPVVVGDSVYAAGSDGTVARFDAGRPVWRINVGQPISGGVGSDGKLVVVGTPKGEVLGFDAATGRETWKARVSSEVLAAPAVAEGLAIVRSGDSRIFGFDAVDGKRPGSISAARRRCRCARTSACWRRATLRWPDSPAASWWRWPTATAPRSGR